MHLVPDAWWRFKLTRALIILEVKSMYFLLYLLHYWGYCVTLTPGCLLGFLKHHRKTGIYHHGSTHSWFLLVAHDITYINGNEARYNSDVVTFLVPLLKSSGLKVHWAISMSCFSLHISSTFRCLSSLSMHISLYHWPFELHMHDSADHQSNLLKKNVHPGVQKQIASQKCTNMTGKLVMIQLPSVCNFFAAAARGFAV